MRIQELSLSGVKLVSPSLFPDERGLFLETYQKKRYEQGGITSLFVQENLSHSHQKVLRGMHFQKSPGQDKLVSVVLGEILDVAVDIRPTSCTFGKWISVILDDKKREQLFIPSGFAHGFLVLSKQAYVSYKVSSYYDAEEECGFRFDDPKVNINWPVKDPILSKKDKEAPFFSELFSPAKSPSFNEPFLP